MSTSEFYGDTSGIIFHSLLLDTILPGYRCLSASTADEDPAYAMLGGTHAGQATAAAAVASGFLGLGPRPPHSGEFFALPIDLPSQEEAEQMWDYFQRRTYPIYPFLDLDSLRASYTSILGATQRDRFGDKAQQERGSVLTRDENQPVLALHFLVFALVQSLSDMDVGGKEGMALQSGSTATLADVFAPSLPRLVASASQASRLAAQHHQR